MHFDSEGLLKGNSFVMSEFGSPPESMRQRYHCNQCCCSGSVGLGYCLFFLWNNLEKFLYCKLKPRSGEISITPDSVRLLWEIREDNLLQQQLSVLGAKKPKIYKTGNILFCKYEN